MPPKPSLASCFSSRTVTLRPLSRVVACLASHCGVFVSAGVLTRSRAAAVAVATATARSTPAAARSSPTTRVMVRSSRGSGFALAGEAVRREQQRPRRTRGGRRRRSTLPRRSTTRLIAPLALRATAAPALRRAVGVAVAQAHDEHCRSLRPGDRHAADVARPTRLQPQSPRTAGRRHRSAAEGEQDGTRGGAG